MRFAQSIGASSATLVCAARLSKRIATAAVLGMLLVLVAATAVLAAGGAPVIESLTVSKITARSAQLQARIDPERHSTKYSFFVEYKVCQGEGTCNMLWRQEEVGSGSIPSGNKAVTVSAKLHLAPGCYYEYHVVATNSVGTTHTGEQPGERAHEFETKRVRSLPDRISAK